MNITLRRANAIQASIQEALKSITLDLSVSLDEFCIPGETIDLHKKKLYEQVNRQKDLTTALYVIRQKVGQANAESGIDVNLTNISFVSKRLEQLVSLSEATVVQDLNILSAKLDKIRNAKEQSYYEKSVATGILSEIEINTFRKEIASLKKQKVEIADALLALNVSTNIALDETTVTVLQKENLI